MSRGSPLRLRDYLEHLLQAIDNIEAYTAGLDLTGYLADRKTQDAVARNFEVIGEASNNVPKHHAGFAANQPEVPWRFAYEMRNALAHGYFKVDHEIVWRTIHSDLPGLEAAVRNALRDLPQS